MGFEWLINLKIELERESTCFSRDIAWKATFFLLHEIKKKKKNNLLN